MSKLDWFTIIGVIAVIEGAILIVAKGDWWIVVIGLIIGTFLACASYLGRKHKHEANILYEAVARLQTTDAQALSEILSRTGVTVNEFNSAFENKTPQLLGDLTCLNNARSPYLQCAINPTGECDRCKDYEKRS
jgi:hypothetical protein